MKAIIYVILLLTATAAYAGTGAAKDVYLLIVSIVLILGLLLGAIYLFNFIRYKIKKRWYQAETLDDEDI